MGMPERKLPLIVPETEAFWTGGKDGALMIQRCTHCGFYQHPPLPICSKCRTETVLPAAVSGRGKVRSWTVNHQQWVPGLDEPFYFAVIELEEQPELYVFSNILAPIGSVESGMPVKVCFEHIDDVWLPMFELAGETAHGRSSGTQGLHHRHRPDPGGPPFEPHATAADARRLSRGD